ncbi:zwei Ig domain protein zig-8 [Procambarus clarkii]|uniref:zwei Ig domain protein zig-8 n=1 Tax=Procambarus clarkii TaxID=6728 RepID=UPI001E676E27|nr:netrin receptor DCC-like [Procambarus clarkii]
MRGPPVGTLLALFLLALSCPHTQPTISVAPEGEEAEKEEWWGKGQALQPQFDNIPSNVTAKVGESAFLPCTVSNLGDKSVTWMRQRDLHILTAGIFTYSADDRFTVVHAEESKDWTLQIKYATMRDSGIYECHVNSDPKISRQVALRVREHSQLDDPAFRGRLTTSTLPTPLVTIEGPAERHIQAGSVLTITCIIHHPPGQPPAHVLWFHGATNIDYDSPRGGVSIQTEKFPSKTRSQVMLSNVRDSDTGEYSCSPSDLPPSVIAVHVQHGQHQAAVQQGGLSSAPVTNPVTHLLLLLLLMMIQRVKTWQ